MALKKTGLERFRREISDAIDRGVETAAYYQLAEQGSPLPYVVYQLQADITPSWRVGSAGASALVTVKALTESASSARSRVVS